MTLNYRGGVPALPDRSRLGRDVKNALRYTKRGECDDILHLALVFWQTARGNL